MTSPQSHCFNCDVPLVPDTGFCGTCGTPAGQRGQTGAIPHHPMPPPFHGGERTTVPLGSATPAHVAAALRGAGATITGTTVHAMAFTATRSSKRTLGIKTRFRGVAEIAAAPGGAAATIRLKLEPGSAMPVLLILTALLLCFAFYNAANGDDSVTGDAAYDAGKAFGTVLGPVLLGAVLPYYLMTRTTRKLLATLAQAVAMEGGAARVVTRAAAAAPPHGFAPPSPPAPPAPPPGDGVIEQLRELAALREQGILTAAEFDQARAALLAKIA